MHNLRRINLKRGVWIAVLALGTVAGFGSEFARARCHMRDRHAAFEQHVADVCVNAAKKTDAR